MKNKKGFFLLESIMNLLLVGIISLIVVTSVAFLNNMNLILAEKSDLYYLKTSVIGLLKSEDEYIKEVLSDLEIGEEILINNKDLDMEYKEDFSLLIRTIDKNNYYIDITITIYYKDIEVDYEEDEYIRIKF